MRVTRSNGETEPFYLENKTEFVRPTNTEISFRNPNDKTTCVLQAVKVHSFDLVSECGTKITGVKVEEATATAVSARPVGLPIVRRNVLPARLELITLEENLREKVTDIVRHKLTAVFESRAGETREAEISVDWQRSHLPAANAELDSGACVDTGALGNATIIIVLTDECGQTSETMWSVPVFRPAGSPSRKTRAHAAHGRADNFGLP